MKNKLWNLILLTIVLIIETGLCSCPEKCSCDEPGDIEVYCDDLRHIPSTLSHEAQHLEIRHSNLRTVPSDVFKYIGLPNLTKLILYSCGLDTIERNSFSGLSSLTYLSLENNNLTSLDAHVFKDLVKIETIILAYNEIEILQDGLFSNLLFLKHIYLNYNKISQIGVNTFMKLPKLYGLHLEGNNLKELQIASLSGLPPLGRLKLADNPWKCDCMGPFIHWVKENSNLQDNPTCNSPERLRGKYWFQIKRDDLICFFLSSSS